MIKNILLVLFILASCFLTYRSYSNERFSKLDLKRDYGLYAKLLDRSHIMLDSALAYIDSAKVEIDYKGDPLDRSKVPEKWHQMTGIVKYSPGYILCLRQELLRHKYKRLREKHPSPHLIKWEELLSGASDSLNVMVKQLKLY
jgi:hypothetical protein